MSGSVSPLSVVLQIRSFVRDRRHRLTDSPPALSPPFGLYRGCACAQFARKMKSFPLNDPLRLDHDQPHAVRIVHDDGARGHVRLHETPEHGHLRGPEMELALGVASRRCSGDISRCDSWHLWYVRDPVRGGGSIGADVSGRRPHTFARRKNRSRSFSRHFREVGRTNPRIWSAELQFRRVSGLAGGAACSRDVARPSARPRRVS